MKVEQGQLTQAGKRPALFGGRRPVPEMRCGIAAGVTNPTAMTSPSLPGDVREVRKGCTTASSRSSRPQRRSRSSRPLSRAASDVGRHVAGEAAGCVRKECTPGMLQAAGCSCLHQRSRELQGYPGRGASGREPVCAGPVSVHGRLVAAAWGWTSPGRWPDNSGTFVAPHCLSVLSGRLARLCHAGVYHGAAEGD